MDKSVSGARINDVLEHSVLVGESVKEKLGVLKPSDHHPRTVDTKQGRPERIVLIGIIDRLVSSVPEYETVQIGAIEVILTHDYALVTNAVGNSVQRTWKPKQPEFAAFQLESVVPRRGHEAANHCTTLVYPIEEGVRRSRIINGAEMRAFQGKSVVGAGGLVLVNPNVYANIIPSLKVRGNRARRIVDSQSAIGVPNEARIVKSAVALKTGPQ